MWRFTYIIILAFVLSIVSISNSDAADEHRALLARAVTLLQGDDPEPQSEQLGEYTLVSPGWVTEWMPILHVQHTADLRWRDHAVDALTLLLESAYAMRKVRGAEEFQFQYDILQLHANEVGYGDTPVLSVEAVRILSLQGSVEEVIRINELKGISESDRLTLLKGAMTVFSYHDAGYTAWPSVESL